MRLEAQAANCFSSRFILKLDDRPFGKVEGRWFGESMDVQLLERRQLTFRKKGMLSSEFDLLEGDKVLGRARRSGFFSSGWDLTLSVGEVQMIRTGWFATGFDVKGNGDMLASVNRVGICSRGWEVQGGDTLTETDLLLIGLLFQIIQRRRANQQHAASSHGS